MTDARTPQDDEQDASDWLASQFDPTGAVPSQKPVQPPVVPPPAPAPPQQPSQPILPPSFPAQPGTPMQARPPQQPVPPAGQAPQPPQPTQGGGFSWGLTPGAENPPAQTPPAAVPPAAVPPAAAPAATPPATPGTWFEPAPPTTPAQPATPPPTQQPLFPSAQPPHPQTQQPLFPPAEPPQAQSPQPPAAQPPQAQPPIDPAIAGAPHESQPPAAPLPFETAALADVAPDARDAPPFWEPEPTQMMDALDVPEPREADAPQPPKQPFTRSVFPEGTELLPEQPERPAEPTAVFGAPAGETGPVSALDALFGENQFKEYDAGIVAADPNENPFARREVEVGAGGGGGAGAGGGRPGGTAPAVSRVQRILLIVLGSMLAVLALVGLFFLGIRLPALFGPAPAVTAPSASPEPSETPVVAVGPIAPGTYHFDQLLGGECLDPYESPWQDEYTVVDCATPHAAQMVRRGLIAEDETLLGAYPGEDALQTRVLNACRATGIFSPASAQVTDGVVAGSYPTEEQWAEGSRVYYCFVSRSSGEPITGDIALPQPTPTPTPAPTDTP